MCACSIVKIMVWYELAWTYHNSDLCCQQTIRFITVPWRQLISPNFPSFFKSVRTWWRHQMETFSTLLAICAGNSPVPGEFPAQRPVTRSFDVLFDLRLNKRLSKKSWGWWFQFLNCHPLLICAQAMTVQMLRHVQKFWQSCQRFEVRPKLLSKFSIESISEQKYLVKQVTGL